MDALVLVKSQACLVTSPASKEDTGKGSQKQVIVLLAIWS